MTEPKTKIVDRNGGITVEFTGRHGEIVSGWPEAREDLGLNPQAHPQEGIHIVEENPHYREDGDDYPYGYGPVVLRFDDVESMEAASDHLFDQATERFEWGASGAKDVQNFASAIPRRHDLMEQTKP